MLRLKDILNTGFITLKPSDKVEVAMELMISQNTDILPVLEGNIFKYSLSLIDLLDENKTKIVASLKADAKAELSMNENQLFFEAFPYFKESKRNALPVVDENSEYIGMLAQSTLAQLFFPTAAENKQAASIGLLFNQADYSLTQIANIVEYNNLKLLQVLTFPMENNQILVHLLINSNAISSVIKGFERYNYTISYTNNIADYLDHNLDDRFNSLIKYLDL